MQIFTWDIAYEVGDAEIDEQHRRLFDLANELLQADTKSAVTAAAIQLYQYVRVHFKHEEDLMRRTNFPGRGEHLAEHGRVLGEMERFAERLAAGRTFFARAYIEDRVPDWFANHTRTLDYSLATFLKVQGMAD